MNLEGLKELSVAELTALWWQAKVSEDAALQWRRSVGEALLSKVEAPPSGEGTTHPDGDANHKITITYAKTRSIDDAVAVMALAEKLPDAVFRSVVRFSADIDTKVLRAIQDSEPAAWEIIAEHITTKPSTPQIKIERIDDDSTRCAEASPDA